MISIIVLAAGKGTRMGLGYNKMNLSVKNKPLYQIVADKFLAMGFEDIVLVSNDKIVCDNVNCVKGGETRQDSVYNGLINAKGDYVLIHDGARPFVSKEIVLEICEALKTNDAVLLAHKVTDTIKILDNGKLKTLNRDLLVAAETPQAFKKDILMSAMDKARKDNFIGTDDTSLVEKYFDIPIKIIYNTYPNIKLTNKDDLKYIELLGEKL